MNLRFLLTTASCAALALTTWSRPASACGGLFCNSSSPVNQAAERILFAKNSDGTVTAAIEILYEGPGSEFAWVLPVPPGETQVGVSSKNALDRLDQLSNPVYQLNTTFQCSVPTAPGVPGNALADSAMVDPSAPGVAVVAEGNAGPYTWVQIEVPPELADPADAAVMWLETNGYDVTNVGPELLGDYLEDGMNLIAFKLQKGKSAGSIRPILLTYESEQPFIPIKPTAVAANEDMGVKVWVLGSSRAIPSNFPHLELNEALINWFNPGPTYNDVVIAAADEADGHGFVTEQSGAAGQFAQAIYADFEADQWEQLRTAQFQSLEQFLQTAQNMFLSYDGFNDVMLNPELIPLREGATHEQFLSCISCYFETNVAVRNAAYPETPYLGEADPIHTLNVMAFLAEFYKLVIEPLELTRAMFEEHSNVTRFYTTLSPDEMTKDPKFDFNAELPDVDNLHVAEQVLQCDNSEWTIRLPQGMVIRGQGGQWPISLDDDFPVNLRVTQLATTGEGEVIQDNSAQVAALLTDLDLGEATPQLTDPDAMDDPDGISEDPSGEAPMSHGDSGGCSLTPRSTSSLGWWLLVAVPWLLRRRATTT